MDKLDLKFLLLYILKNAGRPIELKDLMDMAMYDDSVNFFELNETIPELVNSGHFGIIQDNGEKYILTAKGEETAKICEDSLPKRTRRMAQQSVFTVKARIRRQSDVISEILEDGEDGLKVRCTLNDGMGEILLLELMVANRQQGERFVYNFRKNAELIYGDIINSMLNEHRSEGEE